jgi:5-(carboxyamino)imidazole ribonucleotide synthase
MSASGSAIGILGDGQLAMMLGESAQRRDIPFVAFGKDRDSSFARRFPDQFSTALDATSRGQCKSLTLENEFFSATELESFERELVAPVCPKPADYRHFENKIAQRRFYESLQIPSPPWRVYPEALNFPLVLKASQGGYDGYGVRVVSEASALPAALRDLGHDQGKAILVEEKVRIRKELAQGILVDGKGGIIYLPLVESIQQNGICVLTLSQPTLSPEELADARIQAKSILDKIAGSGITGLYHFEFFLTEDGRLLMNEGAPRPHNSTHLTMQASDWSQFDLLIEFLHRGQLPLPSGTEIQAAPSVMVNLLGRSSGAKYELGLPDIELGVDVYPKLYLKKENRPGRKMGHLNLVDRRERPLSADAFLALGQKIFQEYTL